MCSNKIAVKGAVGAGRSAVAVPAASRRRLSSLGHIYAMHRFAFKFLTALTTLLAYPVTGLCSDENHLLFSDPKVSSMREAISVVDRAKLGFTPIPTNAEIYLEVVSDSKVRLRIQGNTDNHVIFMRKAQGSYKFVFEQEMHYNIRSLSPVNGRFQEYVIIEYSNEPEQMIPTNQVYASYYKNGRWIELRDHSLASVKPILEAWKKP